jgi:hypothetical protein
MTGERYGPRSCAETRMLVAAMGAEAAGSHRNAWSGTLSLGEWKPVARSPNCMWIYEESKTGLLSINCEAMQRGNVSRIIMGPAHNGQRKPVGRGET